MSTSKVRSAVGVARDPPAERRRGGAVDGARRVAAADDRARSSSSTSAASPPPSSSSDTARVSKRSRTRSRARAASSARLSHSSSLRLPSSGGIAAAWSISGDGAELSSSAVDDARVAADPPPGWSTASALGVVSLPAVIGSRRCPRIERRRLGPAFPTGSCPRVCATLIAPGLCIRVEIPRRLARQKRRFGAFLGITTPVSARRAHRLTLHPNRAHTGSRDTGRVARWRRTRRRSTTCWRRCSEISIRAPTLTDRFVGARLTASARGCWTLPTPPMRRRSPMPSPLCSPPSFGASPTAWRRCGRSPPSWSTISWRDRPIPPPSSLPSCSALKATVGVVPVEEPSEGDPPGPRQPRQSRDRRRGRTRGALRRGGGRHRARVDARSVPRGEESVVRPRGGARRGAHPPHPSARVTLARHAPKMINAGPAGPRAQALAGETRVSRVRDALFDFVSPGGRRRGARAGGATAVLGQDPGGPSGVSRRAREVDIRSTSRTEAEEFGGGGLVEGSAGGTEGEDVDMPDVPD